MPLHYAHYEQELQKLHDQLNNLFKGVVLIESFSLQAHIEAIQAYYDQSYTRAKSNAAIESTLSSYEDYIKLLTDIREQRSDLKSTGEKINHIYNARKADVFLFNFVKSCELIFWITTTVSLYSSMFLIALPMLIVQTPLGIAMSMTLAGLLITSIAKCIDCIKDFRSWDRHAKEQKSELALCKFFQQNTMTEVTRADTSATMISGEEISEQEPLLN